MAGDGGCEDDTAAGVLLAHVCCGGLSTEEGASGVDVEGTPPLVWCHFYGIDATHYTRETEEDIDRVSGCCCGESVGHGFCVCDVDGSAEDFGSWEVGVKSFYGFV
jgi:hypothetical protein